MVLGVLATIASIVALAAAGPAGRAAGCPARGAGSGASGSRPGSPTARSSAPCCCGTSIGATSSDDGYNLAIARVSGDAGYAANYYRYFGATEAPFDWYQSVLAHFAAISTAGRLDAGARAPRRPSPPGCC